MKAIRLRFARFGLAILVGGFVAAWGGVELPAAGQVGFAAGLQINSPGDFYGPLSPYGTWVPVGQYGRCWRPAELAPGWRPYTVGYWEWTDCGWYWQSDEPWAWACYHYGYWVFDPVDGWVWVPGTEWAPAWVVWREAPDYIGWAPCGPGGVAGPDSSFVFVDVHHFHDRLRPQELVFNDPTIFRRSHRVGGFRNQTRDIEGMRRQIAVNLGPGVAPIQRATGTRFTPRPVSEVARQTPRPQSLRHNQGQVVREPARPTREPIPAQTGRSQQRLYREAPPVQSPPTGRAEQRLYHEMPTPQPAPRPGPTPSQPVPRQQPQVSPFRGAVPQRPLPPTGREQGRMESQVPHRESPAPTIEQHAPRMAPAPAPPPPEGRVPVRPPQERDKQRGDGQ